MLQPYSKRDFDGFKNIMAFCPEHPAPERDNEHPPPLNCPVNYPHVLIFSRVSQLKYKLITFFVNSVGLWHGFPSKKVHFEIKMCSFYYLFYRLRDGANPTNISMQNLILI